MSDGKAPNISELWETAAANEFAGAFADLRNCEIEVQREDATGKAITVQKSLNPRQAWFVAWYGADEKVRTPATITEVAEYLNVSRATLYKWQSAEWFNLSGIRAWEEQFIASHIPALYRKLMDNALEGDGSASNKAIEMALSIREKHVGGPSTGSGQAGAMAAVQVNVNGKSVEVIDDPRERLKERLAQLAARGSNE